jgi:hypothetical protein
MAQAALEGELFQPILAWTFNPSNLYMITYETVCEEMNRKLGFKRFGIAAFVSKWLSSDH